MTRIAKLALASVAVLGGGLWPASARADLLIVSATLTAAAAARVDPHLAEVTDDDMDAAAPGTLADLSVAASAADSGGALSEVVSASGTVTVEAPDRLAVHIVGTRSGTDNGMGSPGGGFRAKAAFDLTFDALADGMITVDLSFLFDRPGTGVFTPLGVSLTRGGSVDGRGPTVPYDLLSGMGGSTEMFTVAAGGRYTLRVEIAMNGETSDLAPGESWDATFVVRAPFVPVTNHATPMISDVPELAACRTLGSAGQLAPGNGLFRIDIDTTAYPKATCNDGTGAVMYVRRYRAAANACRWVIFLDGGGACRDGQSCGERYCAVDTYLGAYKMSSRDVPPVGIADIGIQSRRRVNHFRGWNHVVVHYCSSDGWSGTASDVELQVVDGLGNPIDYRIHFHGAYIVDAVIGTLRGENGPVVYTDQRQRRVAMPDLDDASVVLLAGSSAGGGGVIRNADHVRDILLANNPACAGGGGAPDPDPPPGGGACALDVRAVIDASTGPRFEDLGYTSSVYCTQDGLCDYETLMRDTWLNVSLGLWGERTDQSCLAYHAPLGEHWRCSDGDHVRDHHITTPMFVRQDLQDSLLTGNAIDAMVDVGGALMTFDLWGSETHQILLDLALLDQTAEEGSAMGGAGIARPGVFGPQCGNHESLRHDKGFLRVRAPTAGGAELTTNQVLKNWVRGTSPSAALVSFAGAGLLPSCP